MKRLTIIDGFGDADLKCCMDCGDGCGLNNENCGFCRKPSEAYASLADYEATGLTPEEINALAARAEALERAILQPRPGALETRCYACVYHSKTYACRLKKPCRGGSEFQFTQQRFERGERE